MKRILFLPAILLFFIACKKNNTAQPSPRSLLMSHKWYYQKFSRDGSIIPFNYCDTNNYLLFFDGGKGGIGNDETACYGKTGILTPFSYTFNTDSNIIHIMSDSGNNYTWQVVTLNTTTLEVLFTAPTEPPAYAPNFDYTYSAK
jgi:hypothetical protein